MSVSKRIRTTLFKNISVADTDGGTAGVDFTITLTERGTNDTFSIDVTSASPAYNTWTATTPAQYFVKLTDRAPASVSSELTYVTIQAHSQPGVDFESGSIAVGLTRGNGAFSWQGAPVLLPSVGDSVIKAETSAVSTLVSQNYTGGTTPPADNQKFWGVRFAAGSTPPGTSIRCESCMNRISGSKSVRNAFFGRNTAPGSTAALLVSMGGNSNDAAAEIRGLFLLNTNANRSCWLHRSNRDSNVNFNDTNADLNTDEEWDLFMVKEGGNTTTDWYGAGAIVSATPVQLRPSTQFV